MSNFITEASEELEHVVWPTPTENKKYMMYTIGTIVVVGAILTVLGYIISNGLTLVREQFPHNTNTPTVSVSGEQDLTRGELDDILKNIKVNTGTVSTGATTTPTK